MLITVSYDVLDKEMSTLTSLLSDKNLAENSKSVIFWVKDGGVRLCAYNGNISTATLLPDAVIEATEEELATEHFITIMSKDIMNPLGTFKGLQRTVASDVEFDIEENKIKMSISEVAMDDVEEDRKHLYSQKTPFLVARHKNNSLVSKSINELNFDGEGKVIDSPTLMFYLDLLYPVVSREVRDNTSYIMFGDEHVYTALPTYVAIVDNAFGSDESRVELPEELRGFKLQNTSANFLRNLITQSDTFEVSRKDLERSAVELTVKSGNTVTSIKCPDMARAHNITGNLVVPEHGVVVDKGYLLDALKRISLIPDPATITIKIADGVATMDLKSKLVKQTIPVLTSKGEGEFIFQLKADMVSNLIFGQSKVLGSDTFIYIEKDDSGQKVSLAFKDTTKLWMTKVQQLAVAPEHSTWR